MVHKPESPNIKHTMVAIEVFDSPLSEVMADDTIVDLFGTGPDDGEPATLCEGEIPDSWLETQTPAPATQTQLNPNQTAVAIVDDSTTPGQIAELRQPFSWAEFSAAMLQLDPCRWGEILGDVACTRGCSADILRKWLQLGGAGSVLGVPVLAQRFTSAGGATLHFENGAIYRDLSGELLVIDYPVFWQRYLAMGAETSLLGLPTSNGIDFGGGWWGHTFQHGTMAVSEGRVRVNFASSFGLDQKFPAADAWAVARLARELLNHNADRRQSADRAAQVAEALHRQAAFLLTQVPSVTETVSLRFNLLECVNRLAEVADGLRHHAQQPGQLKLLDFVKQATQRVLFHFQDQEIRVAALPAFIATAHLYLFAVQEQAHQNPDVAHELLIVAQRGVSAAAAQVEGLIPSVYRAFDGSYSRVFYVVPPYVPSWVGDSASIWEYTDAAGVRHEGNDSVCDGFAKRREQVDSEFAEIRRFLETTVAAGR